MTESYKHGGLALLIPAYNAERFLPRLFQSVEVQTRPFDEIWVYDDCSNDQTAALAEEFGAQVIRGETNKGCSHGKNVLAEATGCQWIHFHDADDAFLPGFVERAHKWMYEAAYDVVIFPYEERDDKTDIQTGVRRFAPDDVRRDPVSYTIREQINPFCGLYRRKAFLHAGGYDTDPMVLFNEDVAMHCRLAQAGLSFAADEEVLVINFRRDSSMSSSNQRKCLTAHYEVMKKAASVVDPIYYQDIAKRLWVVVGGSAAYLDWETADSAAKLAIDLAGVEECTAGALFRTLCRVNLSAAIRLRELLIRLFKPHLRSSYPRLRSRLNTGLSVLTSHYE